MKMLYGLAALALIAGRAEATVLYSVDLPADPGGMPVAVHFAGPNPGFEQTFQFTYTGMSYETDGLSDFTYLNLRTLNTFVEDSTSVHGGCLIPGASASSCFYDFGFGPYPHLTFSQVAGPGFVTITIRNPSIYLDPSCADFSCYSRFGYLVFDEPPEGWVEISGHFSTPDGGHYELIALDPIPVPEPAAWALMIVGLGMAGAVVRSRTRMTA